MYESDVRRRAADISREVQRAKNERKKTGAQVEESGGWWKGEGGGAFAQAYRDIDRDAGKCLLYAQRAADGLYRLEGLIRRAEQERKNKAEKNL